MNVKRVVVGPLETNCYILHSHGEIGIVDPGGDFNRIKQNLTFSENSSVNANSRNRIKFILATHYHWDHIGAIKELKREYDVPVFSGKGKKPVSPSPEDIKFTPERELADGTDISLGGKQLTIWSTPGHSPDSITLLGEKDHRLFVGDLIFSGSYGRTDLPGGSAEQLRDSIARLGRLKGEWKILPGHGPPTTLSKEKQRSPYLQNSSPGK